MVKIWLMMVNNLVGGIPTPLKNDGVKVSWDDFPFPTEWKVIKFHGAKPPSNPRVVFSGKKTRVSGRFPLKPIH